ncbi:pollen-specific leucine-rich repeat extensin-like protein 1 [Neltuma alba]|uniref:pollen-specific leucine-rich repeat extensin-like protein 1 n=1 Tax=Neltuma alba TaxID=207710 RepID=UPI0010A4C02C|nr:pollen-specific leucine-rich repeat extensin-like protein 1 [Prosopis alba]
MRVLEKEVSQRFDYVNRDIRELKGMVASLCNSFSAPSTTFSFEDLLYYPPSPPHHEPGPSTSPTHTSPISTSSPVPPISTPSPTLALITVLQSVPSLYIPPFSPLSHLPPLPIPLPMPTVSIPSPSSSDADKRGEKDSDA